MSLERLVAVPAISVIVPCYNHVAFLRECIDSILLQDCSEKEIIVVDDGSTDGSAELLRSYGDRIVLIEQRGGRQARARNLALAVARGEYVAFLDSDDRYLPGRLTSALDVLTSSSDVDVVWTDFRRVDQGGRVRGECRWRQAGGDFRRVLIAGNPMCNATVTVRRSVLDEIGGFDERVPRACDAAAWYQIAARGGRFVHLDRLTVDYREHGGNDSSRFAPMARERDIALTAGAEAYIRHGVISLPSDRRWLRNVLARQFAFRAAAWVQRSLSLGAWSQTRALLYDALGSASGLRLFSGLRALKRAVSRASRP